MLTEVKKKASRHQGIEASRKRKERQYESSTDYADWSRLFRRKKY